MNSSSNDRPLQGIRVLVTRPEGQGEALRELVEAAGGRALLFPVLVIETLEDTGTRELLQATLAECSEVIFVSPNAVRCALALFPDLAGRLAGRNVYAAGAGTRRELRHAGMNRVIHTESTRASEALLALPQLAPERVAGRQAAIIRGEGGRELLSRELRARQATVRRVAIYRRTLPRVSADTIRSLWHDHRPDVIVITSVSGLQNLITLTPDEYRPALFATPLAVISERIRHAAREAGFSVDPAVAASASDAELVRAVIASMESTE